MLNYLQDLMILQFKNNDMLTYIIFNLNELIPYYNE